MGRLVLTLITWLSALGLAENATRKACPRNVEIENGSLSVKRRGLRGTYRCDRGYQAYPLDELTTRCVNGTWDVDPPVCIAPGPECRLDSVVVTNGHIVNIHEGKTDLLKVVCWPGYRPEREDFAWCNGAHWNRHVLTCKPVPTTTSELTTDLSTNATTAAPPTTEPSTAVTTIDSAAPPTTEEFYMTVITTTKKTENFKSIEPTESTASKSPGGPYDNEVYTDNISKRKLGFAIGLPISIIAVFGGFIMIAMYIKKKREQSGWRA
ncbi:hypothetical protein ScPMuIL_016506 [Solemya velum]